MLYKLILLDHHMPGMNGDEVLSVLFKMLKDSGCLLKPYIVCISSGEAEIEEKMIQAGCDAAQSPPIEFEKLQEILLKSGCTFKSK